ncbi:MAG: sulfotransferase family protein [Acidimicrobiales bacterium]
MELRVVGAGLGRTGTHSLKVALERLLGGRCHHMIEVFPSDEQKAGWAKAMYGEAVDWDDLLADFVAIVDWPGAAFWRELSAANPDALVLLSVRPADAWYRSASNTIFVGIEDWAEKGDPWMQAFIHGMGERFTNRFHDPEAMMAAFEQHNAAVRAEVPSDRLLEWTAADGWAPICERLGVPVPDEPFPVTNTTNDFRDMLGLPPLEPR